MFAPNILLIIMDTVRAQNISCYGYHKVTTPHLDSMSNQADLFVNAFTPAIWTIPSHASLFTGTFPSKHGALNLHRYLTDKYTTLADLLSSNGYETAAFSNNYFISLDNFGLNRGFLKVEGKQQRNNFISRFLHKGINLLTQSEDSGAAYTNKLLRKWICHERDQQKPFFLFANYMEAHAPYIHIPKTHISKYLSKDEILKLKHINQDRQKYLTRSITMTEEDFKILQSVYDAQIAYLDHRINELMDILKANNLYKNSLIIITSDHGDLIGEHDLMHHSYCVYDELIRVPLIVKQPDNQYPRKNYNYLVSLIDIFPTIVDLLNIKDERIHMQLQGKNLYTHEGQANRQYIFVECEKPKNEFEDTYPDFDFSVYDRQLLSIRSQNYKYIWSSDSKNELYDVIQDPREQHNIITTMPGLAIELENHLFQWYNSFEKSSPEAPPEHEINNEIREQLKGLGYF